MDTLIIKLNATGDVVRTTPLLRRLEGRITWVTAPGNVVLLDGVTQNLRCLSWEKRDQALDADYDLVINLEDEAEIAAFAGSIRHRRLFGAYLNAEGQVRYTDDARRWFDLSLISVHGKQQADALKFRNRLSYQELIFEGLGWEFGGEGYLLPEPIETGLAGDVALAPVAGPVWPMKNWAYYDDLKRELELSGFKVNVLPRRQSLREHLADVRNHRCLVSGDSLPMHLALGMKVPCVTIFNCTSPWEIYDYGVQTKVISPLLGEFFYKRGLDVRATQAISLEAVMDLVRQILSRSTGDRQVS
jgi:ADP-heptose:LPS heptosyltransferase